MDEAIPDRILMVEFSQLRCTCDAYLDSRQPCTHIQQCEKEYFNWKELQIQRLQYEAVGNSPLDEIKRKMAGALGTTGKFAIYYDDHYGMYVIEETPDCVRLSNQSGPGPCGMRMRRLQKSPLFGLAYLMQEECDPSFSVASIMARYWKDISIPSLPPSLLPESPLAPAPAESHPVTVTRSMSNGVVDLSLGSDDGDASASSSHKQELRNYFLARFYMACAGLRLVKTPALRVVKPSVHPGLTMLRSGTVAGIALDVIRQRTFLLDTTALFGVTENVLPVFEGRFAQLERIFQDDETAAGQVLLVPDTYDGVWTKDCAVTIMTHTWLQADEQSMEDRQLFVKTSHRIAVTAAELLLRWGHNGEAELKYPGLYFDFDGKKTIASVAATPQKPVASTFDVSDEGWAHLLSKREIIGQRMASNTLFESPFVNNPGYGSDFSWYTMA